MAEENSFLQYGDGLALHNGLPVKWVTAASAITKWEDFDIIIERQHVGTSKKGFTIPYIYTGMSGFENYRANTPRTTMSEATARWGNEIATIDGDVKLKTNKYLSADIQNWSGRVIDIHASAGIPCEGLAGNVDIYGYYYPNTEHFFIGVKFADDYGVPDLPDLTNFGDGGSAYSVIHKLNAPNASNFKSMMNASNYTAMKNVYMPSGSLRNAGINGYSNGFPSKRTCEYFENIYMPLGYLENNFTTSADWSTCKLENITAKNVTAAGIIVPNLSAENINAGTIKFTSGTLNNASVRSFISANSNNAVMINVSAVDLITKSASAYDSTFGTIDADNITSNTGTFVRCNFSGTSANISGNFDFTNCYFKDTTIGGTTAKIVNINHCSGDKVTIGGIKMSGSNINCTFDNVNSLKLNGTYLKNATFAITANTFNNANARNVAGTIHAASNAGVLVQDWGYSSRITAYDCKPNSYNRRSQLPTWSANEFHYKDEIGNQVGNGVLYGNKTYVSGAGTANNLYAGGGTGRYTSADLRNVNFNYGGNRIYLYSGKFIVSHAQTAANTFYYSTSSPYYSTLEVID